MLVFCPFDRAAHLEKPIQNIIKYAKTYYPNLDFRQDIFDTKSLKRNPRCPIPVPEAFIITSSEGSRHLR